MDEEFKCLDCEVNTLYIGEYYMLIDQLWLELCHERRGMLCVGCVEKRLGRRLAPEDFSACPLNRGGSGFRSKRLKSRNPLCGRR